MSEIIYDQFKINDYEEVLELWQQDKSIWINECDDKESIRIYLERNPGISVVARQEGRIVGALLAGHDGRYGYLHHLYVDPTARNQGIARTMAEKSLAEIKKAGIKKNFLQIFATNERGKDYWRKQDWVLREDIDLMCL